MPRKGEKGSDDVGDVFVRVAAFVAIIAAGFTARQRGWLPEGTDATISKIVFSLTLPCAIIHAFGAAEFSHELLWLVLLGAAFTVGSYFAMLLLVRRSSPEDKVFYLCNVSGYNIGCFALPFVQALFPPAQAVVTCLFDAGNAVMMAGGSYALTGVFAGSGKVEHPWRLIGRRLFSSMPFDAYLILVGLALVGIRTPEVVVTFTEPMANANAFLAMFMLGLMVNAQVDAAKLGKVVRLVAARVAMSALFSALIWCALPFDATARLILVMLVWATAGSMGPVFTQWSHGDYGLAGFANAVTIVIGVVAVTGIALLAL